MHSLRWALGGLVCLALSAHAGINSWSVRGPAGGMALDVVHDPTNAAVAYAAAGYALHKSTDGGTSWTELNHDFGQFQISRVMFDPANPARLYVAALGGGIFRSTDGGSTFTRISAIPTDANSDGPWGFTVSADGTRLYYSTIGSRFFRSTNGGATFTEAPAMPRLAHDLVVDPANNAVIYGGSGQRLLKSVNGGDSWTELQSPTVSTTFIESVVLVPGSPNTVWASTATDVYSTQDDGANWTPSAVPLPARRLHRIAGTLYATRSFESGVVHRLSGTWQALPPGIPGVVNTIAVSPASSQTFLAATGSGIFRSTDAGTTWVRSDAKLFANDVRTLVAGAGRIVAGTSHGEIGFADDDSELQRSVVVSPFATIPQNLQIKSIAVHPSDPSSVVVGTSGNGIRVWTGNGTTWTPSSAYLSAAQVDGVAFDPSDPLTVYATAHPALPPTPVEGLHRSTDGGISFSPVVSDLPPQVFVTRLVVDPQNSARLFLASAGLSGGINGVFRSVDSGVTWTKVHNNSATFDLAVDPADSTRVYALADGGLWASTNGGDTFALLPIQGSGGNALSIAVDPSLSSVLYVLALSFTPPSTSEYFLMRSVDRGVSWERIPNSTQPVWAPTTLALNGATPGVLYAGTASRGVQSFEIAPDVALSIQGHTGTRAIGVATFFEVRLDDLGPLAATGLKLNITYPAGAQNVTAIIPGGECTVDATTAQCALPGLKVNTPVSARVDYTPPAAGALNVQASVVSRERDTAPANNTATQQASAAETVDLAMTGSASATQVNSGAAFSYSFQVLNAGPNSSSATRVAIVVDAGSTVGTVSPAGCTAIGNSIDCNVGALASNATSTITVNATAGASGTMAATATASRAAGAVDTNAANDAATVTVSRVVPPPSGGGGGGGGGGGSTSLLVLLGLGLLGLTRPRNLRC
jgi:photosystem II stability/assembly factor-like uncharacterized protein